MKKIIFTLFVLSIVFLSGCVSQQSFDSLQTEFNEMKTQNSELQTKNDDLESQNSELNEQLTENSNFLKEYSVAINNIHIASNKYDLASMNLNAGNAYVETGEYYYEFAIDYFDIGKEQVLDAKELLNKAKTKLENFKEDTPNSFFEQDINNRIEQADMLIKLSENLYSLLDYQKQQLYEVNYGTQAKATEYYNKYNNLIPKFNSNLKKLSDIQNKIDLEWDQDWYPTFQAESTI